MRWFVSLLGIHWLRLLALLGILLLQLSKINPKKLKVDSKTNLLLEANRHEIASPEDDDPEKAIEAPGKQYPITY